MWVSFEPKDVLWFDIAVDPQQGGIEVVGSPPMDLSQSLCKAEDLADDPPRPVEIMMRRAMLLPKVPEVTISPGLQKVPIMVLTPYGEKLN